MNVYKHLIIDKSDDPPTQDELIKIEEIIDRDIPQSFKDFLTIANGGYHRYIININIDGEISEFSFCSIYSTHSKDNLFLDNTFIGEIHKERIIRDIPLNFLPFSRDGGESILYLDLTIPGTDPVIAFIEGLPTWTGLPTNNGFIRISESFDEYIQRLMVDRVEIKELLREAVNKKDTKLISDIVQYLNVGLPNWREILQIDIGV